MFERDVSDQCRFCFSFFFPPLFSLSFFFPLLLSFLLVKNEVYIFASAGRWLFGVSSFPSSYFFSSSIFFYLFVFSLNRYKIIKSAIASHDS